MDFSGLPFMVVDPFHHFTTTLPELQTFEIRRGRTDKCNAYKIKAITPDRHVILMKKISNFRESKKIPHYR